MRRSTDRNHRPPSTQVGESWKNPPDPRDLIQSSEGGTTPPDPPELIQSSEGGTTPPDPPELIRAAPRPLRSTTRGSAHTARDWCLGTRPPERAGIAAGTALADLERPAEGALWS